MFERLLLVWLLLLSAVAFWWPVTGLAFDPFVLSKPYIPWMMAFTMFNVGVMLPRDELQQVVRRWPSVIFGTTIQYTAMPLLGWGMAKLWNLEPDYQLGVILVGCVPGAMASNVITMNARGHTSYSVSLTTAATLLSPVVVPISLYLAVGKTAGAELNIGRVSLELFLQVVLPVLLGIASVRLFPPWGPVGVRLGPIAANLMILWIIATVVAANRANMAQGTWIVLPPLVAVNLLGYLAGYFAGKGGGLPESMRRALTIEVGMQNAGLGTSLAMRLFPDMPGATVPTALYTFGCVLTAMILAHFWAGRPTECDTDAAKCSYDESTNQ